MFLKIDFCHGRPLDAVFFNHCQVVKQRSSTVLVLACTKGRPLNFVLVLFCIGPLNFVFYMAALWIALLWVFSRPVGKRMSSSSDIPVGERLFARSVVPARLRRPLPVGCGPALWISVLCIFYMAALWSRFYGFFMAALWISFLCFFCTACVCKVRLCSTLGALSANGKAKVSWPVARRREQQQHPRR